MEEMENVKHQGLQGVRRHQIAIGTQQTALIVAPGFHKDNAAFE